MNIFTFIRYGDINVQYLIRLIVIFMHFIELKKKSINLSIFINVGIYWSLVEFILVLLKRRSIDNVLFFSDNITSNILQSLIRGYSEGGVFTSIGKYYTYTPISTVLLTFSSLISYKLSNRKNLTSERNVRFPQFFITVLACLYYILKKNKTYSIKNVYLMTVLGIIWNFLGDIVGARDSKFFGRDKFLFKSIAYLYDSIFEIGLLYGALAELPFFL